MEPVCSANGLTEQANAAFRRVSEIVIQTARQKNTMIVVWKMVRSVTCRPTKPNVNFDSQRWAMRGSSLAHLQWNNALDSLLFRLPVCGR